VTTRRGTARPTVATTGRRKAVRLPRPLLLLLLLEMAMMRPLPRLLLMAMIVGMIELRGCTS
jgi:hypothetical protein